MKRIILILTLFISLKSISQAPPYTRVNTGYYWYGGAFDRLHIPAFNTTPSLKTGQWTGAGAVGIDSVLHKMFFYSGGNWIQLASGGNPAGNYGNVQLNRNGSFATPGTDTLTYSGANGLTIKNRIGIFQTTPNAAAALEILSTTQGFLGPRMTGTQMNAISSPPAGLLVYNTDSSGYCFYNGSAWVKVGTGTGTTGGNPPLHTITAATAGNTINNGDNTQTWNWNSLGGTSGTGFSLGSSSAATITNTILGISRTGTATGAINVVGVDISNTTTGSSSTNYGIRMSLSGGANNVAIGVASGANVGFGTQNPSSKAILELASTTQGFLAPRMNTTQQNAITAPDNGLLIYNTDTLKFRFYNGSAWTTIGGGSGGITGLTSVGGGLDVQTGGAGNVRTLNTNNFQVSSNLIDLKTQMSITSDASGLKLSGDAASPGNNKIYSTNGSGTKGWNTVNTDAIPPANNKYLPAWGTRTSFQRNNTIIDQKYYDAFPSVAWQDTTYATAALVWKSAGAHAAAGPAMITYSHDGFSTFRQYDTIKLNGTNLTIANTISVGRGNGNRWIIQWNDGATTTNVIHFARNDNEDENFTADDSLTVSGYNYAAAYGQILRVHGDTLFAPAYGTETGHSQATLFYIKSYNNGVSWSFGGNILWGGTINGSSDPGELDWVILDGTQVSNTRFLALARDNFYKGYHHEITSSDGGSTWTDHLLTTEADWAFGAVNSGFTVDNSWPAMLIKRDTMVYALMGIRNTQAGGGYAMRVFKGIATEVFANDTKWDRTHYTTSYRAASWYQTGGDKDFGYYHPFFTPTGEIKAAFYDEGSQGGFGFPYTNLKIMPVIDNNYYEAFNDANQSVNSGSETTITFPDPFLDGMLYFNNDSSKLYAADDGYYVIESTFQIDTSSLGTYRQAQLKIVMPGNEFVGGAPSTRVWSKVTLKPSGDSKFCWVELHGQGYIRRGEEIRVTFKHDKGSSLNLLNTISDINIDDGGARIKVKKID